MGWRRGRPAAGLAPTSGLSGWSFSARSGCSTPPAVAERLQELLGLAYRADDTLDELDYFRVQDELDGTDHTVDDDGSGRGCLHSLVLNARHPARAIRSAVPFSTGQARGSVILVTTRFPATAQVVKTTNHWISLEGLDHEEFRELFLSFVFGDDKQAQNDYRGLLDIGDRILEKLKGSPLAAKTVGSIEKQPYFGSLD
ncbi:hypothetical protein BAE44_0022748 [Dichanthelium oligosanthes]|uniref:Uncharacterized protein n=1 Tax=Dichanthelium oligosanthes TaxID=888268 RepID=A0A1E5UTT4_9POAL|nr:hypothetical protein BAE44_0022748 [Dichanthelium oligosanthes]